VRYLPRAPSFSEEFSSLSKQAVVEEGTLLLLVKNQLLSPPQAPSLTLTSTTELQTSHCLTTS